MFQDKIIKVVWGKIVKGPEDVDLSFWGLAGCGTVGSYQELYVGLKLRWLCRSGRQRECVKQTDIEIGSGRGCDIMEKICLCKGSSSSNCCVTGTTKLISKLSYSLGEDRN